jgi:hypothetical protein
MKKSADDRRRQRADSRAGVSGLCGFFRVLGIQPFMVRSFLPV